RNIGLVRAADIQRINIESTTAEQRCYARQNTRLIFDVYYKYIQHDLRIRCCFYDWARPANHLVQIRSGRNHWIDRVFLFDAEVQQNWTVVLSCFAYRRNHISALLDANTPNPKGLR